MAKNPDKQKAKEARRAEKAARRQHRRKAQAVLSTDQIADQLRGKLLMIYGAQDDLVHPAHLFRMAKAFIDAEKRFDMFIIPGVDHSLGGWRYLYGLVWDYFADHLIEGEGVD